jgi:hypothetical protein
MSQPARWQKKANFTEKDHQTSVFCFFFGRCKKEKNKNYLMKIKIYIIATHF